MKGSQVNILFLILCFVTSQFFLFACAGLKEIPESEKRYVVGVVVEGGVYGVRIKDERGNILRFITRQGVVYQPEDFHAYCGDLIRVTYYSVFKRGEQRHTALAIKKLETNPNEVDLSYGSVDGIIRAAGIRRYLVHLPKKDLTVAFYPKGDLEFSPSSWKPKVGDPVKVFFTEDAKRFYKKYLFYRMERMGGAPVKIEDRVDMGLVTEILTQRDIHTRPDRFAFKRSNGERLILYAGGETRFYPANLLVTPRGRFTISYYPLLMGDQSLRHVATMIKR